MDNKREYIICAAIWYGDRDTDLSLSPYGVSTGRVICGFRHDQIKELWKNMTGKETTDIGTCQGFLTSENNFVGRKRAAEIAYKAGQTKEMKHELCSDDIY